MVKRPILYIIINYYILKIDTKSTGRVMEENVANMNLIWPCL